MNTAKQWHAIRLWVRHHDGESLSDADRRDLDELADDPATQALLADDLSLHGLLTAMGRTGSASDAFVAQTADALRSANQHDEDLFIASVAQKVQALPQPQRASSRGAWFAAIGLVGTAATLALFLRSRTPSVELPEYPLPTSVAPAAVPTETQALPEAALPSPPTNERSLLTDSFEQTVPKIFSWVYGQAAPCPPSHGTVTPHRGCLQGVRHKGQFDNQLGVYVARNRIDQPLFSFADGQRLRFDYWLGETTAPTPPTLELMLGFEGQPQGIVYDVTFPAGPPVTWNHAEVPFSTLLSNIQPRRPFPKNQSVVFLQVLLRYGENDVFFVDNFEVVETGH